MMKRKQSVLMMAVMTALLTSNFGGVFASDLSELPKENFVVTGSGQGTYGTYDGKIGTFTWTKDNQTAQGDKQGDIISVSKGASLKIQNLDSLNFKEELDSTTKKQSVDAALKAFEGASVTMNIKNLNFGSKDDVLKADQGLHAYGGTIKVTADNIYGNVRGSAFLMNQSVESGGTVYQGILTVHANQNIDLTSNYRGLVGAQSYQKTPGDNGTAVSKITADGTIALHVTGSEPGQAVVNVLASSWGGPDPLVGGGDVDLTIAGKKGVTLMSDHGFGVSSILTIGDHDANQAKIAITSKEGDVSILSYGNAIQATVKNNHNTQAASGIDVSGANVNVVSRNGTAVLLARNATVNVGTNKNQGVVHISGKELAADVGHGSQLTIGNGTNDTTIQLSGRINVADGGTVTVADKTTTVIDADSLGTKALVSVGGTGTFTAEGNAKLVVKGADTGAALYQKEGTSTIDFWQAKNTSFDNPFQYLDDAGRVKAGITEANQQGIAGYIAPAVAIAATGKNDKKMAAFLRNGKTSYNDAIGIGQAGGIEHSTYAVTGLFTDALTDRENTPEKDLWAKGFHSKENIDGLGFDGGDLSLDTQYNGTVVGMDLYREANTTAGVAIAYADGNSSSSDGVAYTKNDATYLGASLYGLKDLGGYRLAADLSYVGGSHDITQYNADKVITAKPDTEAWTLGVKAMKDYDLGEGILTPYAGLRYLRLTTDSYTSSAGLSYDKENQNLFLLPIGVNYSLHLNRGSWDVKPYAGLSYIWTMGDRNADQTVSFGPTSDVFSYDVADAGSFLGKVGVTAAKGDYTFGVGYAYQTGSSVDSSTWTLQASYAF